MTISRSQLRKRLEKLEAHKLEEEQRPTQVIRGIHQDSYGKWHVTLCFLKLVMPGETPRPREHYGPFDSIREAIEFEPEEEKPNGTEDQKEKETPT